MSHKRHRQAAAPYWRRMGRRIAGTILTVAVAGSFIGAPIAAFATGDVGEEIVATTTDVPNTAHSAAPTASDTSDLDGTDVSGGTDVQGAIAATLAPAPSEVETTGDPVQVLDAPVPDTQTSNIVERAPPTADAPSPPAGNGAGPDQESGAAASSTPRVAKSADTALIGPKDAAGDPPVAAPAAVGGCPVIPADATVKGRIVAAGSGLPVSGFSLTISCGSSVVTDADGRFSVPVASTGSNYLIADGNDALGYDGMYLSMDGFVRYRDSTSNASRNLEVAKDATLDLGNLPLPANSDGILSGSIVPPTGLTVEVSTMVTAVDTDGEEFITQVKIVPGKTTAWAKAVPAGDYKIRFANGNPFTEQWWNGAATKANAVSVHINSGQTINGINASPVLAPTIRGTVTDTDNQALAGVRVNVSTASNPDGWPWYYAETASDGTYTVTGLNLKTAYIVKFEPRNGLTQYFKNASSVAAAQKLTIPDGSGTANGIDATIQRGASISGRITDGSGAISGVAGVVSLVDVNDANNYLPGVSVTAGQYTLGRVS